MNELTGRVVVERQGLAVTVIAVVTEQRLVVVVLVPVERLDLEAAALWVAAHDAGHGLVRLAGRRHRRVGCQVEQLPAQVLPAVDAGQLHTHIHTKLVDVF